MNYIPVRSYDNYVVASIELSLLQGAGILCHLKDEFTVTIDPLLSPALGGIKLMIAEQDLEAAQKILIESEELYLQTVPCPNCGEHSLHKIVETISYKSWAGKIKSLLINGQEQQVSHFFRCNSCYRSFKELPRFA